MKRLLLLLLFVVCIGSVFGETLSYETGETNVFLNDFPESIQVNVNGDISTLTRSNELMNQQLGTDSSRRNYISYVNPSGTRFVFDSDGNPFIVQSAQSSGTSYIPVTQGLLVTSSEPAATVTSEPTSFDPSAVAETNTGNNNEITVSDAISQISIGTVQSDGEGWTESDDSSTFLAIRNTDGSVVTMSAEVDGQIQISSINGEYRVVTAEEAEEFLSESVANGATVNSRTGIDSTTLQILAVSSDTGPVSDSLRTSNSEPTTENGLSTTADLIQRRLDAQAAAAQARAEESPFEVVENGWNTYTNPVTNQIEFAVGCGDNCLAVANAQGIVTEVNGLTEGHPLIGRSRNSVTTVTSNGYTEIDEDQTLIYTQTGEVVTYTRMDTATNNEVSSGKRFGSGNSEYRIETMGSPDDNTGAVDYKIIGPDGSEFTDSGNPLSEQEFNNVNELSVRALVLGVSRDNIFKKGEPVEKVSVGTDTGIIDFGVEDITLSNEVIIGGSNYLQLNDQTGQLEQVQIMNYEDANGDTITRQFTIDPNTGAGTGEYKVGEQTYATMTVAADGSTTYKYNAGVQVDGVDMTGLEVTFNSDGSVTQKINGEEVVPGGIFNSRKCADGEPCTDEQKDKLDAARDFAQDAQIGFADKMSQQVFSQTGTFGQTVEVLRSGVEMAQAFASMTPVLVELGLFDAEMIQEWRNNVDSAFESVGLTSSFYVKQFCADDLALPEGKNTAFIEMPDGSVQVGASVQGECTQFAPLNLQQYNDSSDYVANYYIVTGLIKNPPVATNEAEFPLTFQIYLEGASERIPIFKDNHNITQIPTGQSFSLTKTNAFRIYTNKVFDKVCIEMDNPPEYFGGENRFCNVISCNQLDNSADYSSELPPVIETPDGVPAIDVESGVGGSGYNYEDFE